MTNPRVHAPAPADLEGGLASLRGDCARMAPRYPEPRRDPARPVPPSLIHGVTVPSSSARLLEDTVEYGD
ncbi:hypothetical protein ACIQNG_30195 [Streptomyces sp. NPDC091377]|uniref:hypothetical protein n=1 Tax=Streptomyces sp. NPDC091377 TaxID=3365995 RepID=UPI003810FBC4